MSGVDDIWASFDRLFLNRNVQLVISAMLGSEGDLVRPISVVVDFSADGRSSRVTEGQFSFDVLTSMRVWLSIGAACLDGYRSLFPNDCSGNDDVGSSSRGQGASRLPTRSCGLQGERGVIVTTLSGSWHS